MDLTAFMHGGPAEIVSCALCGVMRRNEVQPSDYASDRYDSALMGDLYPRYRQAFMQKRAAIEPLLPSRAEVLEVGSHLGAFLGLIGIPANSIFRYQPPDAPIPGDE